MTTTTICHHDANDDDDDKNKTNDNINITDHIIDDEMKNILMNYGTSKNANDNDNDLNNTYRTRQHEEYIQRLRTFHDNIHLFFGKPIELSPIICALWGWKFHSKDMIQCTSCNALCNVMSIPNTLSIQSQYDMIQMFQQQIINNTHYNYCIYHNIYNCYQQPQPQKSSSSCLTLSIIWTRILPEKTIALLESTDPWNLFIKQCHKIISLHFPFHNNHILYDDNDHDNNDKDHEDNDNNNNKKILLYKSIAKLIPNEMIKYVHNSIIVKDNNQNDNNVKDNDNNEDDRIIMLVQRIIEPFIEMIHTANQTENLNTTTCNRELQFNIAASVILTLFGWDIPTTTKLYKVQNEQQPEQQQLIDPLHEDEPYYLQCPFCGVQRQSKLLLSNLPIVSSSSWKKQQQQNDPLDENLANNNNNERNTKRPKLDTNNDINNGILFDLSSSPTMINPFNSHRYYCPYVCGISSSSSIPLCVKHDITDDILNGIKKPSIPSHSSSSSLSQPLWQIVFDRLYTSLPESIIISKDKTNTEKEAMTMQNNINDPRTNMMDEDIDTTSLIDEKTRNNMDDNTVTAVNDSSTTTKKTNNDDNSMTPLVNNSNNNNSNDDDNKKNDSYNAWLEIHQILRSGISLKKIPPTSFIK